MGRDLLNEAARLSQLFYSLAFHFLFLPPFAHCSAEAHGAGLLAVAQVFADIRPVAALLRLLEEP